jgi:uncharacterized protein (DUF1800 family)
MRALFFGSAAAVSAALAVSLGGSGGLVTGDKGSGAKGSGAAFVSLVSEEAVQPNEAARLAKQATFGPTPELIAAIVAKKSAAAWLDEQFALSETSYADLALNPVPANYCASYSGTALTTCNTENFSGVPVQMRFYASAIKNNDQVRQRVAFALSQIVVASEAKVRMRVGVAAFNQILLERSFGNYRDLLKDVTLNPFMGDFLDMANSGKSAPNENYARELMQLFSVGTVLLNPDGTPQTDSTGATIPAYSNADVKEVARALTGWTFSTIGGAPYNGLNRDYSKPLVVSPTNFDTGSKTFLGKTAPAGATQQANVDAVVDAVFNHPNTGPFICKRLIQQLTIANPTPAYVERVAAVFADNGAGVRGDLKAVVRAIYLDSEARVVSQLPGKVKEPVLLATSLARAISYKSDGYAFLLREPYMGQQVFRAPSVFNYYPYDFPLPQGGGLISPVSKLMTTSIAVERHNLIYDWTIGGDGNRGEYQPQASVTGTTGTQPQWSSWEALGADDGKILDRINLVLLNGTMTPAQRQSLATAMATIKSNDPAAQTRKRAQTALYIVASSPLFQVDR